MTKIPYLLLLGLMVGCARYEYDLTRPPELAGHIGKADFSVTRDPFEYRFTAVDNRLVMQIYNHTDDPMTLQGDRSSVVDPGGQSHPLPNMTLAPRSFVKLILPPPRPQIERQGPSIGFGLGAVVGDNRNQRVPIYPPVEPGPQYLTVYDGNQLYWDWNDESSIRMSIVFDVSGKTVTQEFVIARKKM